MIENAPTEPASDSNLGSSTSSIRDSLQEPQAVSTVEEEGRPGPLYEGIVYDVEASRVYVYVSLFDERAVAFTTGAFRPQVGALLKFRLKYSLGWVIADSPEEIGVVDNERLLDVYKVGLLKASTGTD